MKNITKVFIVIDIFVILCFLMVYGPFDGIRTFWITTSMETLNHKYLAHIFYSEEAITETLTKNYYVAIEGENDPAQVTIGLKEEVTSYESIYEEQILSRNEDDLYKLIEFKYNGFDCYLVAIYDPTRVHAVSIPNLKGGKILTDIAPDNDEAINMIADFGEKYDINVVNTFSLKNEKVNTNARVFQTNIPGTYLYAESAALFIKTFNNKSIVFLHNRDAAEEENEFVTTLKEELDERDMTYTTCDYSTVLNVADLRSVDNMSSVVLLVVVVVSLIVDQTQNHYFLVLRRIS